MKGPSTGWDIIHELAAEANFEPLSGEGLEAVRQRAAEEVVLRMDNLLADYGVLVELDNHFVVTTPLVTYEDREGRVSLLSINRRQLGDKQSWQPSDRTDVEDIEWRDSIYLDVWLPVHGVYSEDGRIRLLRAKSDGQLAVASEPEDGALTNRMKIIINGIESDLKKRYPQVEEAKKAAKADLKAAMGNGAKPTIDNRGEPL